MTPASAFNVFIAYHAETPEQMLAAVKAEQKAYTEALRTRNGRSHFYERENAIDSTWTMESLIKSVWVNIYTFSIEQVTGIEANRADKPELKTGEKWHQHMGLWWDDRYVVDNYNRVDHLSEDLRRVWYAYIYNRFNKPNSLFHDELNTLKLIGDFTDIEEAAKPLVFKQLEMF